MDVDERGGSGRTSATGPPPSPHPPPQREQEDESGTEGHGPSAPGPSYRLVVAFIWIALQVGLVLTANRRVDGAFGFRMFNESSSLKLVLYREVDGPDGKRTRVHVDEGVWTARAVDGTIHRLSWYDRVPMPYWIFDQEMHASYGAKAQLSRLTGALEDLATHIPASEDVETRRFILDVTVRRNGREPELHQLASRERSEGGGP